MRIEAYHYGELWIGGTSYAEDLLLLPGGRVLSWRRRAEHAVQPEDLQLILDAEPELLIVGTGHMGSLSFSKAARASLAERGIALLDAHTPRAVQHWNRKLEEGARVAAAFHLQD